MKTREGRAAFSILVARMEPHLLRFTGDRAPHVGPGAGCRPPARGSSAPALCLSEKTESDAQGQRWNDISISASVLASAQADLGLGLRLGHQEAQANSSFHFDVGKGQVE